MSRENSAAHKHHLKYTLLDPKRNYPRLDLTVDANREEIQHLVENGFLIQEGLFSESVIEEMRKAVDRIADAEKNLDDGGCHGGQYLRFLMDKDPIFLNLFRIRETLSIARAVLGPQVQFDQVDARVVPANSQGPSVPWHTHFRVIPEPLPAFFCYPHAIHCLLYLDDINEQNGQLCILPGSHKELNLTFPADDRSDKHGQLLISLKAGSCFMMHCNLWHKTLPPSQGCKARRLILFGYMPSWLRGDERGGTKPKLSQRDLLFQNADSSTRELLGEFYWG